jgi:hypothetical protein
MSGNRRFGTMASAQLAADPTVDLGEHLAAMAGDADGNVYRAVGEVRVESANGVVGLDPGLDLVIVSVYLEVVDS